MENETSIIELLTTFTVLFIIYILTRKFCIFYNISVNYYIKQCYKLFFSIYTYFL
jgi:hypothetical protein